MRENRSGRRATLAAMIAVALMAVPGGCARQDSEAPPAPERFVIAMSPAFTAALNIVAERRGFFEAFGIEAELVESSSGAASVGMLLDGAADLATSTVFPVIAADFKAETLRILATSTIAGNDNRVVARADRGIRGVADLAGRRVGTLAGGIPEYVLDLMLLDADVSKDSVEIIRGDLPSVFARFSEGALDAICCFGSWVDRSLNAFPGATLALGDERLIRIATTMVARRETVERRREAFVRLLRAYIAAEGWMEANPDAALAMLVEHLSLDPVFMTGIWKPGLFGVRIDQSMVREMENLARWMIEEGPKKGEAMPDVLDYFEFGPLETIDPGRVTVIH